MMSEMATDDVSDGTGFSMSISELAEAIKTHQTNDSKRQADSSDPKKAQVEKMPPDEFRRKVEEWLRKGYLNPPEPKPIIYQAEDKWAFLKRLPKVTVTTNPYAINEMIERGKHREPLDLYCERKQRGETKPLDEIYQEEGMLPAIEGKLDLYSERVKSRRPATSPERAAMAMIKKYGLR
jgi:hypothetical protein